MDKVAVFTNKGVEKFLISRIASVCLTEQLQSLIL